MILPEAVDHSDPSWFGFALTVRKDSLKSRNEIVQEFKQENPEEYAKITESTPPAETQTKDQEQLSAQLKTPEAKQATTFLTELNTHLPSMLPIMIARLAMGEDIKCAA